MTWISAEEAERRRKIAEQEWEEKATKALGGARNVRHSINLAMFTGLWNGVFYEKGVPRTRRTTSPVPGQRRGGRPKGRNGSRGKQ